MDAPTYEELGLYPGAVFDTPYEKGCIVVSAQPDIVGNFDAYDSDGVLCSFATVMVWMVHDRKEI